MKFCKRSTIKFSVFLSLFLFSNQTFFSQEDKCVLPLSMFDIFVRLKPDSRQDKTIARINEELINEIAERKVNFKLSQADENSLKKSGADELILKTIRENPAKYSNERECLYQKYVDNHQSDDIEKLKIALEAAKEYVSKISTVGSPQTQYFKNAIVALESKIKSKSPVLYQEKSCDAFFFNEILSKFTTRRTTSPEPVNKEMVGEITKRKIGFEIDEKDEKVLKDAGANDSLIKSIRENVLPEVIEAKNLYEKYVLNYESNDTDKLKIALEAAKEFVRKFENNECYAEQVKYFKEAIPILTDSIHSVV